MPSSPINEGTATGAGAVTTPGNTFQPTPFYDGNGASYIQRKNGVLSVSDDGIAFTQPSQLIEYYVSLAAPATTLALPGLNGDADGDYLIDIRSLCAVSGTMAFQLNGASTNLDWLTTNLLVGAAIRNDWVWAQAGASPITWAVGDLIEFQGRIRARSGRARIMTGIAYVLKGGATAAFTAAGRYNDTATNITAMSLVSGGVNGLGAGSYIRLARLLTTNPLA